MAGRLWPVALFSWRRDRRGPRADTGRRSGATPDPGPYHPDLVAPLTAERIRAWLSRSDYGYFTDLDGDLGGLWRGRLFYFFTLGERHEILQVRGQWNRTFAIERLAEVLEICNDWNAERVWPKAYVRVRDDGRVHAVCEAATDLEHGVTDAQLAELVDCGLGTCVQFFDGLESLLPVLPT